MATVRVARFAELDAATLYALLKLRVDVFVVEQRCAYPELDGWDTEPGARHVWIERAGAPVAYLRILHETGDGEAGGDEDGGRGRAVRIGRVVVAAEARGAGLAGALMAAALELAGDRPCVLDAQAHLAAFYAGLGFVPTGPEYVEDGIPHLPMARYGSPATSSATERLRPV